MATNWTVTRDWSDNSGQQVDATWLDNLEAFLASLNANATQNLTDAWLLDRVHHNGTQAMSTVTGLEDEIRLTDANLFYTTTVPLRATRTTDTTRRVKWIGPTAPPVGNGYAIAGLDVWEQNA